MTGRMAVVLGSRGVLRASGPDTRAFLQGMISNDIETLGPDNDPEALAAALDRVARDKDLARALAQAGYASYEAGYTREAVVARYLAFFGSLVERPRCAG